MEMKAFRTSGVCATTITFGIDENGLVRDVKFVGGCNGNLKAIGLLVEGRPAGEIADILAGNTCGFKKTSCADQLSQAIRQCGF